MFPELTPNNGEWHAACRIGFDFFGEHMSGSVTIPATDPAAVVVDNELPVRVRELARILLQWTRRTRTSLDLLPFRCGSFHLVASGWSYCEICSPSAGSGRNNSCAQRCFRCGSHMSSASPTRTASSTAFWLSTGSEPADPCRWADVAIGLRGDRIDNFNPQNILECVIIPRGLRVDNRFVFHSDISKVSSR